MSRLPLTIIPQDSSASEASLLNLSQIDTLLVTFADIQDATKKDVILSKVHTYVCGIWPSEVPENLLPYYRRRFDLTTEDQCLLLGSRVVIPDTLQGAILQGLHETHPGMSHMKKVARSYVWWPGLDQQIEDLVKGCVHCQQNRDSLAPAPLNPWIWPTKPWQRIHVDFASPFLGKSFFIVVDAHSKWPEVHEMSQTTTEKTITVLRHLFSNYGLPHQLVSDNGPQFTSEEFRQFMLTNGIRHIRSAPYHPSSNGQAKRFVKTFKDAMKAMQHQSISLTHRISNFLLRYRTTPHSTTNQTPSNMFLGREIRTRVDLIRPCPEKVVQKKQEQQIQHHDIHAKERTFEVGQRVMARNYQQGPKWKPTTIIARQGKRMVTVKTPEGQIWRRHFGQIRDSNVSPDVHTATDVFMEFKPPSSRKTPSHRRSPDMPTAQRCYPNRPHRPPDRLTY